MNYRALLAVGLFAASLDALAADLWVVRVSAPATLLHAGNPVALESRRAVVAGDVVSAGARGKVALQLAGNGLMTLSSLGDMQVFDAQGPRGKLPATAKLKLLAGALRVDSRAAHGKPAQDLRLNVGTLKARVLNADAWGANTAEGDTLCLIAGSLSVQTGGTDERLDSPGNCLRREPDGQLSHFVADSDPVILGAIAATRFEDLGSIAVIAAIEQQASAEATLPAPAPLIVSAPAVVTVPSRNAPPPSEAGAGWTIVVLSLTKPEVVAARAQALADQGLPATTRTTTINGVTMHRVAVGSFATQAEARAYAASTLAKSGIKGWASPL